MHRFPYDVKNFYTINFIMPPIMCKFVQSGIRWHALLTADRPH